MEELEQAILECSSPDYELHYKTLEEKARYILAVAKNVINKENEEEKRQQYEGYIEDLVNGIQV
jgi:3-methyladenine DNA glycosylase/8-oxoguanine DNA glycosylase